jgi:predicted nucleotidyltransferase
MRQTQNLPLAPNQKLALDEIRRRLLTEFPVAGLILYGSAVRGELDQESDIDLLVLTTRGLSRRERHRITDVVFEVNLERGTNFSTLVVDLEAWQTGQVSLLPIHEEVLREGIAV